jgi:hypothetical protein
LVSFFLGIANHNPYFFESQGVNNGT